MAVARKRAPRAAIPRRDFLRMAALGAGAVALAGTTRSAAASVLTPTAPALARQGGTITVYSALNESTNNAFVAAFKAANPGIEVDILPVPAAGELQTRIRTERNAPKADVFIGGDSSFHDVLGKEGLLEAYMSPNAEAIAPTFRDPNGNWNGWYLGIFGIVVNKDRWAAEFAGKPKPTTWDDLLDPDLAGKLDMPDPVRTGGGYIFLANQVFRFGRDEEAAMAFMKALHANIGQYVGTAPQGIELVGQGQFVAGPNWGHDILTAANRGQPVEFIAPLQCAFEIGGVSIVKGGPNTEAAKVFMDWVLTKEANALNVQLSNRLSVFPDVPPAPGAPTLDSVDLVDYDRAWATENQDRLRRRWQAEVGL